MFIMPHSLSGVIASALNLFALLILAEVVVSWLIYLRKLTPYTPWVRTLRKIVDPVLEPVRRVLPASKTGGMDFSPMIVILLIQFICGLLEYR